MYYIQLQPISNSADWLDYIEITNSQDGSAVDCTGVSFTLNVKDKSGAKRVIASTDNGMITFASSNKLQILVPKSSLSNLSAGSYDFGLIATNGDDTDQTAYGTIQIIDGVS